MPNIKSAKKRVKVIAKKTLNNKMFKSNLKTTIKAFDVACEQGNDTLGATYTAAVKKIDKAVSKGILHKNTAARRKSKLTKKLNSLGA